jgi:hypothetical protein
VLSISSSFETSSDDSSSLEKLSSSDADKENDEETGDELLAFAPSRRFRAVNIR